MQREEAAEARLQELRSRAGPARFAPGFPDRVMARLQQRVTLADGMQRVLLRLAPAAAAAAIVLAAANLAGSRGRDEPLMDRVLSLRPLELASPYALQVELNAVRVSP